VCRSSRRVQEGKQPDAPGYPGMTGGTQLSSVLSVLKLSRLRKCLALDFAPASDVSIMGPTPSEARRCAPTRHQPITYIQTLVRTCAPEPQFLNLGVTDFMRPLYLEVHDEPPALPAKRRPLFARIAAVSHVSPSHQNIAKSGIECCYNALPIAHVIEAPSEPA
jgi:hypothetical protein